MPHYIDIKEQIHFLESEEFEHFLPEELKCVKISAEEAKRILDEKYKPSDKIAINRFIKRFIIPTDQTTFPDREFFV